MDENLVDQSPFLKLGRWQWWLMVAVSILFIVVGQAASVLLGRFYYVQGGNSEWMATIVQAAGFPILFIPLFLLHPSQKLETSTSPSIKVVAFIYDVLGLLVAEDTALILNSVGFLSLSAALIAVNEDSEVPSSVSKGNLYIARGDLRFDRGPVCERGVEGVAARDGWLRQRESFVCADFGLDGHKSASMRCRCGGADFQGVVVVLQYNQHPVVGDHTSSCSDSFP
ncbi:Purine permease 11 isoform 2 [Hibiscus syriacus]|uniref:Purine permease 11 isoform 2 n=1 Tax=Hibiscus syriacus TaxID=106335 RepID=A0A6A3A6Z1_HIBSY|nr:Purine permease 11 isoform 2 [Hibiscus syriacus]